MALLWAMILIGYAHYETSHKLFDNEFAIAINYLAIALSFPACAIWWLIAYIVSMHSTMFDMYAYSGLSILQWITIVWVIKWKRNNVHTRRA